VPVSVRVDPARTSPGSHPVHFTIQDAGDESVKAVEKSIFYVR
jgi:hypothetical protein